MSLFGAIVGNTAKVSETRRSDGTMERTVSFDVWVSPAQGAHLVNILTREAEQRTALALAQEKIALLERELRLESGKAALLPEQRK